MLSQNASFLKELAFLLYSSFYTAALNMQRLASYGPVIKQLWLEHR
jgi:hypothetical protein